jgi:adenylate cyclase class 1
MTDGQDYMKPDSGVVRDVLLANRKHFVTYNITRLRELLRYLPAKKLDLFYTIPLLLHVNSPDYPGYVDNPRIPHGIYGFYDSGFWRLAKKRLNIEMKDVRPFVSKSFCIKGIYLIGSAGSLGQTERSDFDYWVVVDKDAITDNQRGLLKKKLRMIEKWADETYGHHLTFFLLDSEQVRQNDFSGFDEEGLRTAQRTLLKEEFYRTFILIGGQIPYWAVLPVGLEDFQYREWVAAASCGGEGFFPDDYIDLGNLTCIKREECYGALLWQFCKAQEDPVKALIKASLMVEHLLCQQGQGVLCDITKKRIPESRLDSCFLDPYALAFDRVLTFYENQGDQERLDFIRQCIYLRIIGFPVPSEPEENSPKNQVLKRYLREWSWGRNGTEKLQDFSSWRENEKLKFEKKIIGRLWDLYGLVFRSVKKPGFQAGMPPEDLVALKNKAASRFKKKEGKLPFASVHLRTRNGCSLFVACQPVADCADWWAVYDGSKKVSRDNDHALFSAPELLKVMGWVVFNGLLKGKHAAADFQNVGSPVPPGRVKKLLSELMAFFSNDVSPQSYRQAEPQWERVFVALDTSRFVGDRQQHCADFLVQNSWGETFFRSLDLCHSHNRLLKHHEIAKGVWNYLQCANPDQSFYRFFDLRTVEDPTTAKAIEGFLSDLKKGGGEDDLVRQTAMHRGPNLDERKKRGLLLDLF